MNFLKDKRVRYGTFSTAMMLFAFVLFVLVNLIADEFNRSFDLTQDRIFSLTERSHNFLETLDRDVTITHIIPLTTTSTFAPIVTQLLEEYAAASNHITVHTRDPLLNPTLIHQLASAANRTDGIPDGSVVVESGGRIRVLTLLDMLSFNLNMWGQVSSVQSYNFESEITRAIHFVTQGDAPIVYYVTGSGEPEMHPEFLHFLERENFVVREVNLVTSEVPPEADILLIPMPARDWTADKAGRIEDFLIAEGRAFIAAGYTVEEMPNMVALLGSYGISPLNYFVIEGNANYFVPGNPLAVLPATANHEIFETIHDLNFRNLAMGAIALETMDMRRSSTNIEPLWSTSRNAFARVDVDAETFARTPDDIPGPFNLAVAITDTRFIDTTHTTQIVVVGNMFVLHPDLNDVTGGGNFQFVLDSFRWLHGQPASIFIPGRTPPGAMPLALNEMNVRVLNSIAVGAIPIVTFGIGVVVWLRRRHN